MNFSKFFSKARAVPGAGQALGGIDPQTVQKELEARGITQDQLAQFASEIQQMLADGRLSKTDVLKLTTGTLDPAKMPPALAELAQKVLGASLQK